MIGYPISLPVLYFVLVFLCSTCVSHLVNKIYLLTYWLKICNPKSQQDNMQKKHPYSADLPSASRS